MLKKLIGIVLAATVASVASAQDYKIRPGDSLQIEVLEDTSLNRSVLVLPDGSINFPLVGTIRAAGRSIDEVKSQLAGGLASNFAAAPNVYVSVGSLATRQAGTAARRTIGVFAMGEVATPGRAEVLPGTTVLQFLAQAGGFTRFAAQKRVQLRRFDPATGAEKIYLFNYDGQGGAAGISGSTMLQAGDVIVVPQRRLFE